MATPSRTYLLLQERLGADLADHVTQLRDEGGAWSAIAQDLKDRTEILVTPETLRLWFDAMPKGQKAGVA